MIGSKLRKEPWSRLELLWRTEKNRMLIPALLWTCNYCSYGPNLICHGYCGSTSHYCQAKNGPEPLKISVNAGLTRWKVRLILKPSWMTGALEDQSGALLTETQAVILIWQQDTRALILLDQEDLLCHSPQNDGITLSYCGSKSEETGPLFDENLNTCFWDNSFWSWSLPLPRVIT